MEEKEVRERLGAAREVGGGVKAAGREANSKGGAKCHIKGWPEGWWERRWDGRRAFGAFHSENLRELFPWSFK